MVEPIDVDMCDRLIGHCWAKAPVQITPGPRREICQHCGHGRLVFTIIETLDDRTVTTERYAFVDHQAIMNTAVLD